jgi:hypothetical protein
LFSISFSSSCVLLSFCNANVHFFFFILSFIYLPSSLYFFLPLKVLHVPSVWLFPHSSSPVAFLLLKQTYIFLVYALFECRIHDNPSNPNAICLHRPLTQCSQPSD